jgi:predicted MPP superfamily phosphohydrolase
MERKRKKRAHQVSLAGRLLALLPASCILFYPIYLAAQLDTVEETYASGQWPREFDGLRIAFVSDIHYGSLLKEDRVRKLAERVNGLQADIVLLGGDYGEHSNGAVEFFQLKPGFKARIAVLGAFGNHDRTLPESNVGKIAQAMRQDGVIPMLNDVYLIRRNGRQIAFASTDDFFNGSPDLKKVARLCEKADFTVYFPHNPDILPETYKLRGRLFYQLALCGHTHGGQVAIGGHAIKSSSIYGDRFLSGWIHEQGVDILVTNGVGTSGLPVRLGARPQIHLLTMKTKE